MKFKVDSIKGLKEWLDGYLSSLEDWDKNDILIISSEIQNGKFVYIIEIKSG